MKAQKQKMSIIKKMLIAVVAGFAVGILCLFIKGQINADVWDVVDAIFFQDITWYFLYYRTVVYARFADDDCSSGFMFT